MYKMGINKKYDEAVLKVLEAKNETGEPIPGMKSELLEGRGTLED